MAPHTLETTDSDSFRSSTGPSAAERLILLGSIAAMLLLIHHPIKEIAPLASANKHPNTPCLDPPARLLSLQLGLGIVLAANPVLSIVCCRRQGLTDSRLA